MRFFHSSASSGNAALFALALTAGAGPVPALADTALVLDRVTVLSLVARAPEIALAETRIGEARAHRVGAGALALTNPELTAFAGPRQFAAGARSTDIVLSLLWPLELSGARSARKQAVEGVVAVAEAEVVEARRVIATEALDLWIAARAVAEAVHLETIRVSLDAQLVRIATVRRQAGVAGDAELALATVLAADSHARLQEATAQHQAAVIRLKGKLGLPWSQVVVVTGPLGEELAPPPLSVLVQRGLQRGDVLRAERSLPAAHAEAKREARTGVPVPRVLLGAGRENETFARVGLEVPLPIYQRNQTNRAVADARVELAGAERTVATLAAETEVRAAHAAYLGARDALRSRASVLSQVADVEKLAWRGYELGSTPLMSVVISRREAAAARAAHLEASVALARARVLLDSASGTLVP